MPALTPLIARNAIVTLLTGITGVGRVHPHRRLMRDDTAVKAILFDNTLGRLQGWFVSPAVSSTMVTERHPGFSGIGVQGPGNNMTTFQFQLEGYQAWVDHADTAQASETLFMNLVWLVADTFNSYGVIPNAGNVAHFQLPANVEQFGGVMLAGTHLCHYARINVGLHGRTRPA